MPYKYIPPEAYSPARSRNEIEDQFRRWNEQAGEAVVTDWDLPMFKATAPASVTFCLRGARINVKIDAWTEFATNLRCCYLNIRDMRLAEARGSLESLRDSLLSLAPGKVQRNPWEVLGLREGASAGVIEATYKALAKERHPDRGGSDAAMRELNEAYEQIKAAF